MILTPELLDEAAKKLGEAGAGDVLKSSPSNTCPGPTVQDLQRAADQMMQRSLVDPHRGHYPPYPEPWLDRETMAALLLILMSMIDARSGFGVDRDIVRRVQSESRMTERGLLEVREGRFGDIQVIPNGQMMTFIQVAMKRADPRIAPRPKVNLDAYLDPPKKPEVPKTTGQRNISPAAKKLRKKGHED